MDEPTTGLDPVNRKKVWHMIQSLKRGRVIVLTTHSMQEAEVLSDKVAIMAHGDLCCVGSSLYLKNKFGGGYHINIVSDKGIPLRLCGVFSYFFLANELVKDLKSRWSDIVLDNMNAGSMTFTIPPALTPMVPDIVSRLEELSRTQMISEWGLSHASLEEVFLRVTKSNNFSYEEIQDTPAPEEEEILEDDLPVDKTEEIVLVDTPQEPRNIRAYPLRALFRKNFALQKRQTCSNICQVVTPILVVVVLVILQVHVRHASHVFIFLGYYQSPTWS